MKQRMMRGKKKERNKKKKRRRREGRKTYLSQSHIQRTPQFH
jgi:hypothetical protein